MLQKTSKTVQTWPKCAYNYDPYFNSIDVENVGDKIKEEIKKELENVKTSSVDALMENLCDKMNAEVRKQVQNIKKYYKNC